MKINQAKVDDDESERVVILFWNSFPQNLWRVPEKKKKGKERERES